MADQSSPPSNRSGSDDLSEQFHPAFEFLNNADVDDDDMDFDPETVGTNPMIYFDVGVADDDDDDVNDVDYEVEEDEDNDDDYEDEDEGPIVVGRGSAEDDERILTMGAIIAQQTADEDEEEEDEGEEEEEEGGGEDPQQSEGSTSSVPHGSECVLIMKTGARMLRLLNARGLQALLRSHGLFAGGAYIVRGGGDDDEEDVFGYRSTRYQRRQRAAQHPPPKVPSENGIALMNSGFYGNNPSYADETRRRKKKLATRIMWRELGIGALGERRRDTRLVFQV